MIKILRESISNDLIKRAINLGKDAFKKHIPNKPILDKDLMLLIAKNISGDDFDSIIIIMKSWQEGWLMP
jgi:hypothetical protein